MLSESVTLLFGVEGAELDVGEFVGENARLGLELVRLALDGRLLNVAGVDVFAELLHFDGECVHLGLIALACRSNVRHLGRQLRVRLLQVRALLQQLVRLAHDLLVLGDVFLAELEEVDDGGEQSLSALRLWLVQIAHWREVVHATRHKKLLNGLVEH